MLTDGEVCAISRQLNIGIGFFLGDICIIDILQFRELVGLDDELLTGKHLTLVDERLSLTAAELDVEQHLVVSMMRQYVTQHLFQLLVSNELALLRLNAVDADGAAVLLHLPNQLHIVNGLEEVLVVDL